MYRKFLLGIKCIFISILAGACTSIPASISNNSDTGSRASGRVGASGPVFTGNGGRGLVIAVLAPSMPGGSQANSWMPQLFQDLITADFVKYSAMTVLDRLNESLVLAEQQISASGNYSDKDYIAMGRLTNARYIVAGNILSVSGRYSITFRINNTETNEIQASFSKQYILEDIESGLAAKEAVRELLAGMGVELTAEGERRLLTIQEREVRSQVRLAQGMAAERNNNELQSLIYFQEALNANRGLREASQRIQAFGQGSPGASIRERAEWATTQKARWEKIFNDLDDYVYENLRIVVYDFSTISDQFDARAKNVTLTITPGAKLIFDSTVLSVWKTVIDQWDQIKNLEENKSWANSFSLRISRSGGMMGIKETAGFHDDFYTRVELYDEDGIRIASNRQRLQNNRSISRINNIDYFDFRYGRDLQILPQNRYFSMIPFTAIKFSVPLANITDNMSAKVIEILFQNNRVYPARIMSVQEWEEWLRSQ